MKITEARELFAYNAWANELIVGACESLAEGAFTRDMGSSFRSVRDTLVHILTAEAVWLSRWQGESPTSMKPEWTGFLVPDIRQQWVRIMEGQTQILGQIDDARIDTTIAYHNLAGEPQQATYAQMFRHVINHSSYHRGQITTMLRQLGASAPSTDLIRFYRTLVAPGASPPVAANP